MTDTVHDKAANFIAFFEDFRAVAYWDVNAYRLGFGSDTEGPEQYKVTRHMATTYGRAMENLKLRIVEFEKVIVEQLGLDVYGKLPVSTQVALLSIAYNYGSLLHDIVAAVEAFADSGLANFHGIVNTICAHERDNHGINAKRRFAEAAMVASEL